MWDSYPLKTDTPRHRTGRLEAYARRLSRLMLGHQQQQGRVREAQLSITLPYQQIFIEAQQASERSNSQVTSSRRSRPARDKRGLAHMHTQRRTGHTERHTCNSYGGAMPAVEVQATHREREALRPHIQRRQASCKGTGHIDTEVRRGTHRCAQDTHTGAQRRALKHHRDASETTANAQKRTRVSHGNK
jgi:hypothetical protein